VLGVVKRIGHRLVDGHGHRFGAGVWRVARVNGEGFNAHDLLSGLKIQLYDTQYGIPCTSQNVVEIQSLDPSRPFLCLAEPAVEPPELFLDFRM
jgi:hypothetical protein